MIWSHQWEFDTDMLALECALLGVVYRYAVREDRNPDLKDGERRDVPHSTSTQAYHEQHNHIDHTSRKHQ